MNAAIAFVLAALICAILHLCTLLDISSHRIYDASWVNTHSKIEKDRRREHKTEKITEPNGTIHEIVEDLDLQVDDITPLDNGRARLIGN